MLITKTDPFTGEKNTMDLPVTLEQLKEYHYGSSYIQHVFPELTADEREFIRIGIMPDFWPGEELDE